MRTAAIETKATVAVVKGIQGALSPEITMAAQHRGLSQFGEGGSYSRSHRLELRSNASLGDGDLAINGAGGEGKS